MNRNSGSATNPSRQPTVSYTHLIIVGVEEKDFDLAIKTIYHAFSDENGIVRTSDLEPVEAPF